MPTGPAPTTRTSRSLTMESSARRRELARRAGPGGRRRRRVAPRQHGRAAGQHGGPVHEAQTLDLLAPREQLDDALDHVVDVALGVDAARDGETHEVERRPPPLLHADLPAERAAGRRVGAPLHHVADLAGADAELAVEPHRARTSVQLLAAQLRS